MMSFLLSFVIFVVYIINNAKSQNITRDVDILSDELKSLFCDGLSVGNAKCKDGNYGIQDFVDSFIDYFDTDLVNASITAQQVITRLNDKLNLRATFIQDIASKIEDSCKTYGYGDFATIESIADFETLKFAGNADRAANLPADNKYNAVYGDAVCLSASTYRLPNNVDYNDENVQKDAQISSLLDETMIHLYEEYCIDSNGNEEYCNMYFGTINGVFRQYPGTEMSTDSNGEYNSYDPRFRPWYVSAASGGQDVVIIIDQSGSMQQYNRMDLAKQAVISVLKTLGSSSFVSVIAFNGAKKLSCFGEELVAATARNIDELVSFVSGLPATGGTDFEVAFDAAFTILENGAKSCQTSILFLTDGKADDVSDLIETRNTDDIGAVIFSYTLGTGADAEVPRKVASITNGIYTHINDEDTNLITIMSSYYLYYAYGAYHENSIIVTSPYLDFDTGVAMITMAMPVYYNKTFLVGVAGIDIPLSFLSDAIGDITIGRKSYSFIVNQESEAILHPLIPDPLTTLFSEGDEYNAVYIENLEPEQFDTTLMTTRQTGSVKLQATVKQPAGNVAYNGYVYETAHLLYFYSAVGPSTLSVAIAIYTESNVEAPNVKGFGFKSSPNDICDNSTLPSNCLAPFNIFNDFSGIVNCSSPLVSTAAISLYGEKLKSERYPSWFVQPKGWESPTDAINIDATCPELDELHDLTNRLGTVSTNDLPFGGFRTEISSKILNSIKTMTSLFEFWKPSYLDQDLDFNNFYFGTYQGVFTIYPGIEMPKTYNPIIRPWYQRATSYPDLFVFATPFVGASSGVLLASGATTINAPNSQYPYGVAAFGFEFSAFMDFWTDIMSVTCDNTQDRYCYLIDSSGFLLYYEGIDHDQNDSDIGRKFLGDSTFEPTLMQSLIDREFYKNESNVNFQDNTIDISYQSDNDIYSSAKMDIFPTEFARNNGKYTVHRVSGTNLYVIYIEEYQQTDTYPIDCPNNDVCLNVQTPGCLTNSAGSCISAIVDVCIEPDTPFIITTSTSCSSEIDNFGICILKTNEESDMCASNFNVDKCGPGADHAIKQYNYYYYSQYLIITFIIFFV